MTFKNTISDFQVLCSPVAIATTLDSEIQVPASAHSVTLTTLTPGTRYRCEVRASTRKGFGDSCSIQFWTKPTGDVVLKRHIMHTMIKHITIPEAGYLKSEITLKFRAGVGHYPSMDFVCVSVIRG